MSECRIEIYLEHGSVTVDATKSPSGQLFVNRGISYRAGQWSLSHTETTKSIAHFDSPHAAIKCAEELDSLDWSHPAEIRRPVYALLRRWGGERNFSDETVPK